MKYIKELNAFKNWLLVNEIPSSAIVLWYTLMAINNSVGWKRTFNAPNAIVQQLSSLSKQGLLNARKHLEEQQLIQVEKGKKGKAPVYEMCPLVRNLHSAEIPIVDQSEDNKTDLTSIVDLYDSPSQDQSQGEMLPIPKQKLKKKEKQISSSKQNPFLLYEQNFGILRPITRESLIAWLRACSRIRKSMPRLRKSLHMIIYLKLLMNC